MTNSKDLQWRNCCLYLYNIRLCPSDIKRTSLPRRECTLYFNAARKAAYNYVSKYDEERSILHKSRSGTCWLLALLLDFEYLVWEYTAVSYVMFFDQMSGWCEKNFDLVSIDWRIVRYDIEEENQRIFERQKEWKRESLERERGEKEWENHAIIKEGISYWKINYNRE